MFALLLAATLTIEDYATMAQPSVPRWSPDGKRIAYVLTKADLERSAYDSDVWIVDATGRNGRQLTRARGADFQPRWSPDGTRIAFLSDRDGKNEIHAIDPDGGEAQKLAGAATPIRAFEWSPDGKSIAFTRIDGVSPEEEKRAAEKDDARVVGEGKRHVHLFVGELSGAAPRRLTGGDFTVGSFSWSPDGTTIAFDRATGTGFDDLYRTDIYTVNVATRDLKPLVVRPGLERFPTYSPDGEWIAFVTTGGVHDWLREHEVHVMPARGGPSRTVSEEYGRTPESIQWSGGALWIEGPWNTTTQLYRVNADGSGWTDTTRYSGTTTDPHVHRERAAYVRQSLTEPPEVYADGLRVTNHNAAYRDRTLGETRLVRWKNPVDGVEIEGLLTLPVGTQRGPVPLVVFVHGGPASRFDQSYLGYLGQIYAPQVLAANGVAVLRPNPRGSGGYGATFRRANQNDWGGMDWLDVEAGVDQVIADRIADPQRLGMMGWSYGGYLTAWSLGRSDRLRAVSIGAAITDLVSFHGTSDIRDFIPHYFPAMPPDLLRSRSPLWNLKKTKAKVLIQHGATDERVPLSQGTMLYRALDELGMDVKMIVYPRSGHGVREPKLRMDLMRRNVDHFVEALKAKE